VNHVRILVLVASLSLCGANTVAAAAHDDRRPLAPDDYFRLANVTDPQISPDGAAVAYVVTSNDRQADVQKGAIWLAAWDGREHRQVTYGESAADPRFSSDGRYLSFLSARPADAVDQVWLLDRSGGEARQVTHVNGTISSYAWSPDNRHLVLVMSRGADPAAKAVKPIVIDDYHFKSDGDGYLNADSRKHLVLVDVANGELTAITTAPQYADENPVWSPDGKLLAYISNHGADADRSGREEIYLIEPRAGAVPHKLTEFYSPDVQRLGFSPDGQSICFVQGQEPKYNAYISDGLAVVDIASGHVRRLSDALDRAVSAPGYGTDGSSIDFIVADDGSAYPARVQLASGKIERRMDGIVAVQDQSSAAAHTAVIASSDTRAPEVFALEDGRLRALSSHNDAVLAELKLGSVEDFAFKSRDGTEVHGQIVKPPSYVAGRRYPTILWIHGGPNGQDQHELIPASYSPPLERQMLAARGYVVLAINYRGSSGRGVRFQRSIFRNWGHKEVEDLLAGVDEVVAKGLADPTQLGIGGWSYGALLTNYTIASDNRFRAAISGAGSGNQVGMYGLDEYALQWNDEIGPPWKQSALYLKLSYPFFHADRIHTPTLFVGGDKDFNVPIAGSEHMYLALRTLHVATQLIVYPGQFHEFTRPSFLQDRAERYIAWYAKYLKAAP
jgi:dipeptidyl aminopeptidase/acylaminoacyl peptidase